MKLLNIHRKYLINKVSAILLILLIIISLFINLASIFSINNEYNWFDSIAATTEYVETFLLFYKLVVINLMCYIFGNSFNKEQDSYHLLITGYQKIKYQYVITKLVVLTILLIVVLFINYNIMLIIGIFCSKIILVKEINLELFLTLGFVCLIYGFLSCLFSLLFNNNYAYFLAGALFVFSELIKDSNTSKVYFVFFPTISIDSIGSFGIIHLCLLFIIYAFLVVLGYVYKK